jgi:hypothetical protein
MRYSLRVELLNQRIAELEDKKRSMVLEYANTCSELNRLQQRRNLMSRRWKADGS